MIPIWTTLRDNDRNAFWAVVDFLKNRLAESDTIEWALDLRSDQRIERMAIIHLLNDTSVTPFEEPWATAWRLIEESWSYMSADEDHPISAFDLGLRLHAGDRSASIVTSIVSLVAPRLEVKSIGSVTWNFIKKPRRAKTFNHLLSASLTSGYLINLEELGLMKIEEVPFLIALANALDATVNHGLDASRRIGWDGQSDLWRLGSMHRARYSLLTHGEGKEREPDAHKRGIAPSVKLFHAVVTRIAELKPELARPFVQRWHVADSPVHIRLWAEPRLNRLLVPAEDIEVFFREVSDHRFWEPHEFPEVAELRALRFSDLGQDAQNEIVRRIRKRPPYNLWPRSLGVETIRNARLYWALRELKRLEVAGNQLPLDARSWLEAGIVRFPDLAEMKIDEGLPSAPTIRTVPSNPDARYDVLHGIARLRALEEALATDRRGWDDDPGKRAGDWLGRVENTILVLHDLEGTKDGGDDFPLVWDRVGWVHIPEQTEQRNGPRRELQDEAERVLRLLEKLSDNTLSSAIASISNWLRFWSQQLSDSDVGLHVWLRVWPVAKEATNAKERSVEQDPLSALPPAKDEHQEPQDLDTLNTPSGKLLTVFLSTCPSLEKVPSPFAVGSNVRQMRDAVLDSTGRSGLIVRYRLLEHLPYFLTADRDWTKRHLISPLLENDEESLFLWRAASRGRLFTPVLRIIGNDMAQRANDRRLGRETRTRLVFSLVVETLHAFRESREPAVANARIQQMLRSLDDVVRAAAADTVQQFVKELSGNKGESDAPSTPEEEFHSAAAPFLAQVWPQERSLATPGVSRALADLPATSGEAFAEAVEAVERFLVPFQCWSMLEYGLYGDEGGVRKLSIIDSEKKARALLRLLDLTVGTAENAIVPIGLASALDQISSVVPPLVTDPAFRRLSTAARR